MVSALIDSDASVGRLIFTLLSPPSLCLPVVFFSVFLPL